MVTPKSIDASSGATRDIRIPLKIRIGDFARGIED
jgi:hypothetical protein